MNLPPLDPESTNDSSYQGKKPALDHVKWDVETPIKFRFEKQKEVEPLRCSGKEGRDPTPLIEAEER